MTPRILWVQFAKTHVCSAGAPSVKLESRVSNAWRSAILMLACPRMCIARNREPRNAEQSQCTEVAVHRTLDAPAAGAYWYSKRRCTGRLRSSGKRSRRESSDRLQLILAPKAVLQPSDDFVERNLTRELGGRLTSSSQRPPEAAQIRPSKASGGRSAMVWRVPAKCWLTARIAAPGLPAAMALAILE